MKDNLIKKTCKDFGITQKELAEMIGLTDRTLSKYATNEHIPKNIINHINLLVENSYYKEMFESLQTTIQKAQKIVENIRK
ncbi:Helix-turn-helix protein [Thiovulum sp. ES]|nr:Helix-turn-helix protein [Thiovulum sp. ES]